MATRKSLRQAVELILALHDNPDAAPEGSVVRLDPMAEAQLRAALAPREPEQEAA